MKKVLLFFVFALVGIANANAQKVKWEESMTRMLEPLQDVYVRPMVCDMEMIKTECQQYGPFMECEGLDLNQLSEDMLENAKTNALYRAATMAGADIIIAATFNVKYSDKTKGLEVVVRGYPAKYVNWHKIGAESVDLEWVQKALFPSQQLRTVTGADKTGAVKKEGKK